tara:strand:- start:2039 stop:2446 length:408 start_codon:yes stop_codon:yes gene_type:complete
MNRKKFEILLKLKKLKKNKSLHSLNILIKEKKKLSKISKTLEEMLKIAGYPKDEVLSTSLLKQISIYQEQLQKKLETSNNRKKYLSSEISTNIKHISELNKQTETIKEKIFKLEKEKINLNEKNTEINILNKPSI